MLNYNHMKNTIIALVVIIIIIVAGFYFINKDQVVTDPLVPNTDQSMATTTPEVVVDKTKTVIGKSVGGRDIVAYHYYLPDGQAGGQATATTEVLFVGGIHGGYEANTSLVAYELMDYLQSNPIIVPSNVKVTVIPVLNPDGLAKVLKSTSTDLRFAASDLSTDKAVLESGRFNGNTVDLNRNFDCDWQASAKWQSKTVSGGTAAFSEPEAVAIKNYVEANRPAGVVVWYSAAGGVFASNCHNGVLAETKTILDVFAKASGYKAYQEFNFYETTGDMTNWLAKNNIPAISVLLTSHTDTEWTKNKAGIEAILKHYTK